MIRHPMRFVSADASAQWPPMPAIICMVIAVTLAFTVAGNQLPAEDGPVVGPLDARCPGSGPGLTRWFDGMAPIDPTAPWSMVCWVKVARAQKPYSVIAGFGDGVEIGGAERFFTIYPDGIRFWSAETSVDMGPALALNAWQHLAACWDGMVLTLHRDGVAVGAPRRMSFTRAGGLAKIAPPSPWVFGHEFNGQVADFCVFDHCLSDIELAVLAHPDDAGHEHRPFVDLPVSPTPDVVILAPVRGQRGLQDDQDTVTIPAAPAPVLLVRTAKKAKGGLTSEFTTLDAQGEAPIRHGWEMADGTLLRVPGEAVSTLGFDTASWYDATVPGTALTTLVEQGVYPDPLHGRNNLAIPDDLSRRNWWYRVCFVPPDAGASAAKWITFNGINYHAEIWLNGVHLGDMTGAFARGTFAVGNLLRFDLPNVLAVHVWPPPHPGHPHEQSFLAGDGPNGGDQCFDGPTFFCTEGWDWIPGIRDRCTGIWQDVVLHYSGTATIGDPQVVTTLPLLPDLSRADLAIHVPVTNASSAAQTIVLSGEVGSVTFSQQATLAGGETRMLTFSPDDFPQLVLAKPKLWWPNGYGEPALQDLHLHLGDAAGHVLDQRQVRFGVRTLSYEFDPQLVIKVNGQRILCAGGNWGMDDALKRVSRERLEPYIRMHHDAHMNMIRNWCGQSTEEAFYQLCDEYGIMVWNEFWMTTDGWNVDPLDGELMLDNIKDVVLRFRNHPCIALWCGRNEGVPPPRINERLARMLQELDGTRHYQPNSRDLHLCTSGPWSYVDPSRYFTDFALGFSTELGLHSVPCVEAVRSMLEVGDQWPPNDAWAYHDLHITGNGDAHGYLNAIATGYGRATNLTDFCRRAQMVNYVNYRAMFEAWNAAMWHPASGLLIWMSHPTWPSMAWQLYSHDYQANAALFGVQKACEPIHVQCNANDNAVMIVNHRFDGLSHVSVSALVVDMNGNRLWQQAQICDAGANASTTVFSVTWPDVPTSPVQFLRLELRDERGALLSDNFYWHAPTFADQHFLTRLPPVTVAAVLKSVSVGGRTELRIHLSNASDHPALMIHLLPVAGSAGSPILPVYASDNYLSLLPGEARDVVIQGEGSALDAASVRIDGWNIQPALLQALL